MNIGIIGLGIMGAPIAANYCQSGYKVFASDIDESACSKVAAYGASITSYREISENCQLILLVLPNGKIVQEVLFGNNGLCNYLRNGQIICDLSSITPLESQSYFSRLKELNVDYIDAPVSGGEEGAVKGKLAIMCGGDETAFNKIKEFLTPIAATTIRIGASGSGSVCKLANQIMVNLNIVAMSEAMLLANKAGADPLLVYEAVRNGLAGSAVLDSKIKKICTRNFTAGGKISINHKDVKNVLATAQALQLPLPFTSQLFTVQEQLMQAGKENLDHCAYLHYFENLADFELHSDLAAEKEC